MDAQTVRSSIEQHKDQLRSFGLRRIGIFGSYVMGTATPQSDIDLILDFDPDKKTYKNFYQGTVCLESFLHHPVDAVTPQGLSPHIKPYVDRDITYVQIAD